MTAAAQPRSTTCCCQDLARGRLLPPGKLNGEVETHAGGHDEAEFHDDGNRSLCGLRPGDLRLDADLDGRAGGVVRHAGKVAPNARNAFHVNLFLLHDFPLDGGNVLRNTAIDLVLEDFHQFRAAHFAPHLRILHLAAVESDERIGIVDPGIGLHLVIVGGAVRVVRVGVATGAHGRKAELAEHLRMVRVRERIEGVPVHPGHARELGRCLALRKQQGGGKDQDKSFHGVCSALISAKLRFFA